MNKKHFYLLVVSLLAMPHVTYLMEDDSPESSLTGESSSSHEGSLPKDSSSSLSSSAAHDDRVRKLSSAFVARVRDQLQRKREERQHFLGADFFDEEGHEDRVPAWEGKSPGTWRKEKERLDRLVTPRRLQRMDAPEDFEQEEGESHREPTPLRAVRDSSHRIRRSRSFLGLDQVEVAQHAQPHFLLPGRDPRRGSLEDPRKAWRRGYERSSIGSFDLRGVGHHGSQDPQPSDPTYIDLPPGSHLSIPDPHNPGHHFVVRSRPGSMDLEEPVPGVHGSGGQGKRSHHHHDPPSRDRFSSDGDSPEPRHGSGPRKGSIDYDQIYRFRNYPLVALLILAFDRYPKTTLIVVGAATVLAVWKYRAFVDFLEKAKEKTMGGGENGKQNQLSPGKNSKKESETLNNLKAAFSCALKNTWKVLA